MSRGDQREAVFLDDADRYNVDKTLAEACPKTGWQVRAFCLIRNHYHLVLPLRRQSGLRHGLAPEHLYHPANNRTGSPVTY